MIAGLARRAAASLLVVLGVAALVFALVEAAPGDPADVLLGERPVPPEVAERLRAAYGLDRPAPERFARWLSSLALRGEWGWSVSRGRPVAAVLADALPPTLLLGAAALLLHAAGALALGAAAGRRPGGRLDRALTASGTALAALPPFWLGLMAILVFSGTLGWLPASSLRSVGAEGWPWPARALDLLRHLVLPAAVLGLGSAASTARFVRAGLAASLREPYARAARARGAGEGRVLAHALRPGLLPALTVLGASLPVLVSGALAVEVVFAWPGMGRLAWEALLARDLPVVLGATVLTAAAVVAGNLLADLAVRAADPRTRRAR